MVTPSSVRNPASTGGALSFAHPLRSKVWMPYNIRVMLRLPKREVTPGAGPPGYVVYAFTGDPVGHVAYYHQLQFRITGTATDTELGTVQPHAGTVVPSRFIDFVGNRKVWDLFDTSPVMIGMGTNFYYNGSIWQPAPFTGPEAHLVSWECTAQLKRLS